MKIIFVIDNLDLSLGGGVGSFVFDLCYDLSKYTNQLYLIGIVKTNDKNDVMLNELRENGVSVFDLGINSRREALIYSFKYIRGLHKRIKQISKGEDTVCNLHLKLGVLYGTLATIGLKRVKCIETYHSLYSNYWIENKVLSPFIKKYIPCSNSAGEEFIKRFHPKMDKVKVIPNGVDLERIRSQTKKEKRGKRKIAISVGRFTSQKNFHVTAKAFSKIRDDDFIYKIYGQGESEQQIIENAGHSTHVIVCGPVSRQKILGEIANAAIVVMPSLWEGLSIFMLETIALGCPMMISNEPSLRDIFEESPLMPNETWRKCNWGYLVDTSNSTAYYDAMVNFLENPCFAVEMRRTVKKQSEKYDIKNTTKCYMMVYQELFKDN